MSDNDSRTRFNLDLPGFSLTISGDKVFVEDVYRRVSQDILPVVFPAPGSPMVRPTGSQPKKSTPTFTWVYGVTQYYNKVYAVDDNELRRSILGPFILPTQIKRIYVDRDDSDLFTSLTGSQKTLWAEFTPEGKEKFFP